MMQPIETIEYRGFEIKIYPDEAPMSPIDEFDMLSTMVCSHSRYDLGHKQYDNGFKAVYETLVDLDFNQEWIDKHYELPEREFIVQIKFLI